MNQNKQHYKKCLICGSNDLISRDDEDVNSLVCNMCDFASSK
jgi:hypothetical protein